MNCPKCRRPIQKAWNFCPNCGYKFRLMAQVNNLVNKIREKNPNAKIKLKVVKKPNSKLRVVEPDMKKTQDKIFVKLPGVLNPQNIRLRVSKQSIELNAYTKDKRYFRIINLEGKRVIKKQFKNELLIISIA
jgi:uncharacterized Zn finger protein (UPF0148 family)